MPLDPRIPLGAVGGQVEPTDPFRTLAAVSGIHNQQLQRQEAQQRIAINQAAEARLNETALLDQEKRREDLGSLKALDKAYSIVLNPDGSYNRQAMQQSLVASGKAHLWGKVDESLTDLETKMIAIQKGRGENENAVQDLIGAAAQKVKLLPQEIRPSGIVAALAGLSYRRIIPAEVADGYIGQIAADPSQADRLLDEQIAASTKQQELKNAAQRPVVLGNKMFDATGKTLLQTVEPTENPDRLENFLMEPFAKMLGRGPFKTAKEAWAAYTPQEIDRAIEMLRLDQRTPTSVTINQGKEEAFDKLPYEYRVAARRATNNLTGPRRDAMRETIVDAYENGQDVSDIIVQSAIESEGADDKRAIMGRRQMAAALTNLAGVLKELPTGYLKGTIEDTVNAIGQTTDPKLVRFKAQMMASLADYRRATTGAAFSEIEAKEYESRFPSYRNQPPVNVAKIQGFLDQLNSNDRIYWETKLGKDGAKLVRAINPSDVMAAPAAKKSRAEAAFEQP